MLIFHFQSLSAFLEYNVVTINFIKYENNLQFPSLTLCRVYNGSAIFDNANVINCTFNLKSCDHLIDTLIVNARGGYRKCMRFNGKKKSSSKIITTSARFGYRFGLRLSFIHEKGQRTFAYIGDNFDLPVDGEFYNYLEFFNIQKTCKKCPVECSWTTYSVMKEIESFRTGDFSPAELQW